MVLSEKQLSCSHDYSRFAAAKSIPFPEPVAEPLVYLSVSYYEYQLAMATRQALAFKNPKYMLSSSYHSTQTGRIYHMDTDELQQPLLYYHGHNMLVLVNQGFDDLWPRLRETLGSFIIVLLLIFPLGAYAASAPEETLQLKQEMSFSADKSYRADWATPVTTYNGSIYYIWVDDHLRTMIAKKNPTGTISTSVILQKTVPDEHHTQPSVAVDKNGYIHVAYNMHQTDWQYKVSNQPEDISSFTFIGGQKDNARGIPGELITYPHFVRDNNGVIYVTFRHRVGQWEAGGQGIGIAKYNVGTQRWTMLGGTDYPKGVKTFYWTPNVRVYEGPGKVYQALRAGVFFDAKNRMHVCWDDFVAPGKGTSAIMYAYSDDGGQTFKRANGQTIATLPITPSTADVVNRTSVGKYYTLEHMGALANGRPIVFFFEGQGANQPYFSTWDGTAWTTRKTFPSDFPATAVTDRNGIISAIAPGDKIIRSLDNGDTWKSYAIPSGGYTIFDYSFLADTTELRFQTVGNDTVKVWTARFSTEDTPTRLPGPTGLTVKRDARR